jgi:hypothetical protein
MKITFSLLFAAAVCAVVALSITGCSPAYAQTEAAGPEAGAPADKVGQASSLSSAPATTAPDAIANFLTPLVVKFPWIASIVSVLGIARLILKPLFTFLHTVVQATPSLKDDELLLKTEESKAFKWVVFGLDYVFSIKLIHPTTTK